MGLKILLIEKDRVNGMMVKSLMTKMGCEICHVNSDEETIKNLLTDDYDLILVDCHQRITDGSELVCRFPDLIPPKSEAGIIGISTTGKELMCADAREMLDGFLYKPVSKDDLQKLVDQWTEKKNNRLEKDLERGDIPSGYRILAADDDERNRLVLQSIFKGTGNSLDIVSNGVEAITACMQTKYDIILMDVMMPIKDGRKATADILQLEGYESTPVVGLTALTDTKNRDLCFESGMCDVLPKPYTRKIILETVLGHLAGSAPVQQDLDSDTTPSAIEVADTDGEFDLERLINEFGGDHELAVMAVGLLAKDLRDVTASMTTAIDEKNCDDLRKHAHKIRGAAANLTCYDLSRTAEKLEDMAEQGQLTDADTHLSEFERKAESLLTLFTEKGII